MIVTTHESFDPYHFAGQLVANNSMSQLLQLIAAIDDEVADWEFTEKLINHFLALKEEREKELKGGDYKFEPKLITDETNTETD